MRQTKTNNTLEGHLNKQYPILVYGAEEGGYVAEIEELPGCMTQGESLEEVFEGIENARRLWIEVAYEEGMEIPSPRTEQEYSGKFVIRLPKYLHRKLSQQATKEEVSLNQYVVTLLASGVPTLKALVDENVDMLKKLREMLSEKRQTEDTLLLTRSQRNWVLTGCDMDVIWPKATGIEKERELTAV